MPSVVPEDGEGERDGGGGKLYTKDGDKMEPRVYTSVFDAEAGIQSRRGQEKTHDCCYIHIYIDAHLSCVHFCFCAGKTVKKGKKRKKTSASGMQRRR